MSLENSPIFIVLILVDSATPNWNNLLKSDKLAVIQTIHNQGEGLMAIDGTYL